MVGRQEVDANAANNNCLDDGWSELDAALALAEMAEMAEMAATARVECNSAAGMGDSGNERKGSKISWNASPSSTWERSSSEAKANAAQTEILFAVDDENEYGENVVEELLGDCPVNDEVKATENAVEELIGDHPANDEVKATENAGKERSVQRSELRESVVSSCHAALQGNRGRQKLTEAEKEERRIRRVLANRESARQTIRRRQAFREELMKRVADLSLMNQTTKMEKELLIKQYHSLKNKNEQLKGQIAKAMNFKFQPCGIFPFFNEETRAPSSAKYHLEVHNRPTFPPYTGPLRPPISFETRRPPISFETRRYHDQFNPRVTHGVYMPHCTWVYTPLQQVSGSFPMYADASIARDINPGGSQHNLNPFSTTADYLERSSMYLTPHASPAAIMSVDSSTKGMPVRDGETLKRYQEKMAMPPPMGTINHSSDVRGKSIVDHVENILPEISSRSPVCSPEISAAMNSAAEARKRRKELKKMKHFHGRQVYKTSVELFQGGFEESAVFLFLSMAECHPWMSNSTC